MIIMVLFKLDHSMILYSSGSQRDWHDLKQDSRAQHHWEREKDLNLDIA